MIHDNKHLIRVDQMILIPVSLVERQVQKIKEEVEKLKKEKEEIKNLLNEMRKFNGKV